MNRGPSDQHMGYIGRIPIRNLWLLVLYASEFFRVAGEASVEAQQDPEHLADLVAEFLSHAAETRLRRRLSPSYKLREDVLHRVRGRIDVLKTERHQLLSRGRVACRYEDLTIDTIRNRFVRAALERVAGLVERSDLAQRCHRLASEMQRIGVSGIAPTRAQVSADRFGRHDIQDQSMVSAAQLVFDLALPTEAAGSKVLAAPLREELWVRRLFERAVGGFLQTALEGKGWRVSLGKKLSWQIGATTDGIVKILPGMIADIVLDHDHDARRIVIDTKFNSIFTHGWHHEEVLRSQYLYQLYAYLMTQVGKGEPLADGAEGILLHPSIGSAVDEVVEIQGHYMRFVTVDLTAQPQEIRARLSMLSQPIHLHTD
jgi:5-methylcytosine-specific restriction enzyme subunit McrC